MKITVSALRKIIKEELKHKTPEEDTMKTWTPSELVKDKPEFTAAAKQLWEQDTDHDLITFWFGSSSPDSSHKDQLMASIGRDTYYFEYGEWKLLEW